MLLWATSLKKGLLRILVSAGYGAIAPLRFIAKLCSVVGAFVRNIVLRWHALLDSVLLLGFVLLWATSLKSVLLSFCFLLGDALFCGFVLLRVLF